MVLLAVVMSASSASGAVPSASDAVKATLSNGMRVVIIRNVLAPVVSTDMTYLVGSRDDPAQFPGMAHAQEHMMFRGTKALSTAELGTLATALGGNFNAATTDTLTQYEFTVPATNLDAILRIESDRMRDVLDAQAQWQNERGAIEQEVLRDESAPGADFFRDAQALAFAGTPYEHQGVGTRAAFDRLTGPQIKAFYQRWYAPNNAVFVIAGNVDPARVLAQIRARFESIPRRAVPAHAVAHLRPLRRVVIRKPTSLVYALAAVGFRMPGINSPDFLPSYVLQEILGTTRGPFHALVDSGEVLDGGWTSLPYFPEAQLGFATAALAPGADPSVMVRRLQTIVTGFARRGVPRELFETTKRQAISGQELSRNSISALASDWATTIALDREPSIAREQQLIADVTLADVNRVARRYLDPAHAIVGALTPSAGASNDAPIAPPQQGPENPLGVQPPVTQLPDWAGELIKNVTVPQSGLAPTETKLANGIRLIVAPEGISDSVEVFGDVRTNAALQEPAGKEGIASIVNAMFQNGTQSLDRTAFRRAEDAIDSQIAGGTRFGMQTTSRSFDRAVALLAENELRPRLDAASFAVTRRRVGDELATALNSAGRIAQRQMASKLLPANDPALREPTLAGVQSITLDDVKTYYQQTFRPDLTTIVVVGKITPSAARTAIERAFGAWTRSGPAPSLDLPAVPLNLPASVRLPLPALGQDAVTFAQTIPLGRSSPQYYPLQLGNAIFGGGSAGPEQSRLFRDIRQNAGLVYSIGSQFAAGGTRTRFTIDFQCLPENEGRISSLIDGEIEKMKTEPVGDFELSLMKASIVRRTVIADASINSIGSSLLNAATNHMPLDQSQIDAREILATNAKAVQDAFNTFVHPENFVRVVVGP